MPVIKKKKKTLEMIDNSVSFKNKIKDNKKVLLPNTTCKNVAYKLALDGAKVLLIDLDPKQHYQFNFIQIKL